MKLTSSLSIAMAAIFLTGCEIKGPSLKLDPPKVKVDGVKVEGSKRKHGNGGFCPPGQAKKGNC